MIFAFLNSQRNMKLYTAKSYMCHYKNNNILIHLYKNLMINMVETNCSKMLLSF